MPIDAKVKALTAHKLSSYRTNLYKKYVKGGVPSVFLHIGGKKLKSANAKSRSKNFIEFVNLYFFKGPGKILDWTYDGPLELKPKSMGYKAFELYSRTDYGSAVIKEMIDNAKKYKTTKVRKGFTINMGRKKTASAGALRIFLPNTFPSGPRFPIGGQKIFDLAIIHHQLTHTILVRGRHSKTITIYDELWTVRNEENPVRMKRGKKLYEPRYVYYNGKRTINIITGDSKLGEWTVNKYDPRILVKLKDKDAL